MAKYGYVVYVVTARGRGNPDNPLRPLDDLDGKGTDLVTAVRAVERTFWGNPTPEKRARFEHAYRFNRSSIAWPGQGRLLIHSEAGPYGRRGRMVEVDTGSDNAFGIKDAAMIPLRAGLMTFPRERFGLLFCERVGNLTIKNDYEEAVLKKVGKDVGILIKLETHVDIDVWEAFLEEAEISSVKAVYFSTRREDFVPSIAKESKLAMEVQGGPAQRAGRSIVRQLLEARRSGSTRPDAVLTGDLRPAENGFRRDRVILKGTAHGVSRTVVFEESGFPQWVYETERAMSGADLVEIWEDHGPRLIARYLSDPPA